MFAELCLGCRKDEAWFLYRVLKSFSVSLIYVSLELSWCMMVAYIYIYIYIYMSIYVYIYIYNKNKIVGTQLTVITRG